jgi:hypothetical protein
VVVRLHFDDSGDGPFIETTCPTCRGYCGGECDHWDCMGDCGRRFHEDGDEPRQVVDGETYCQACSLALVLFAIDEEAA